MSYAVSIPRVALGEGLSDRLRVACASQVTASRSAEVDQASRRCLEKRRASGTVIGNALLEKKIAEDRARASAAEYARLQSIASHASLILTEISAKGEQTQGPAAALATARAAADLARTTAETHQASAKAAVERALAAVPPEEIEHVAAAFDAQIAAGLAMVVLGASVFDGATAIGGEVSGHVEDKGAALGSPGFGVRVYPVE